MNEEKNERSAVETATESVRRSRTKAKREGDLQLAALLLRTEAQILDLEASREEVAAQRQLFEAQAKAHSKAPTINVHNSMPSPGGDAA